MKKEMWCYVATDPAQPGAAWAACIDKPEWTKGTAKTVAGYIKQGATVMRVSHDEASVMLRKWLRPEKPNQSINQIEPTQTRRLL
jgi:hypothetical protein